MQKILRVLLVSREIKYALEVEKKPYLLGERLESAFRSISFAQGEREVAHLA